MADNDRTDDEDRRNSHITSDREEIRRWADERDAVPAARDETEGDPEYRFFDRGAVDEDYREREWDEFFDEFESREQALVYRDDESEGIGHHEIVDRDEAAARATVEDRDVEERLLDGETVTTEVTETTVVEREVRETETIESEVVDTETVRSRITEAELLDWELLDTDADVDVEAVADAVDRDVHVTADEGRARYDDVDFETRVDGAVEAEIEETWRVRREVDERATVESDVVDADVEERDRVEDDTVEIDVEGIQRSIVEGGVFGGDADTDTDAVDRGLIETEQIDAGRLESQLVRRETYDERIRRRKLLRFDFAESSLIDTEELDSELVESDIVEAEYEGSGVEAATATADRDETADAEERRREGTDSEGVATGEGGDPTDDTGTVGAPNDVEAANEETRRDDEIGGTSTEVTSDDRGKTVVDEAGEEIGVVSRVENETAYVDPRPGFFDRIGAKLGWGGRKEETQPLEAEHVNEIDRDRIVVDATAEAEIEDADRDETR